MKRNPTRDQAAALRQTNDNLNLMNSITRHDILNQIMGLRAYLELSKEHVNDPVVLEYLRKGEQAALAIQEQIEFIRNYQDIETQAPKWQALAYFIGSAIRAAETRGC